MKKKGETKRQHYVPRMILRNFSTDSVTTGLLVLATGKRVEAAPIGRQCYEPYFYGSDQIMERSFAAEEAKVAGYLGDLSDAKLESIPQRAFDRLKLFVHYQYARTRAAAESLSNHAGAFADSILRGTAELNSDDKLRDALDHVHIGLTNAQHLAIWNAAKTTPLMLDLAVKFIRNATDAGFVIGDHPVVAYNQFAEHHPRLRRFPTSTGLALKGLQLFMPLSPDVALAIYDPSTYRYGTESRGVEAKDTDVRSLNEMQAINAWECVFFAGTRTDNSALEELVQARRAHPPRFAKPVAESPFVRRRDGRISRFVIVANMDIKIRARLSFARTIDTTSYQDYEGPTVPLRSTALVEFAERYGEYLEEGVKRGWTIDELRSHAGTSDSRPRTR